MNKKILLIPLALLLVISLVDSNFSVSEAKKVTLRWATGQSPRHFTAEVMKWEVAEIERRTEGRVKIELYLGKELMNYDESVDGVTTGAIDMQLSPMSSWSERNPIGDFFSLFFLFDSFDQWIRAEKSITPIMEGIYDKMGVKWCHYMGNGHGALGSTVPVGKLEDWKGLKIRGTGPDNMICIKACGALPVRLAVGEVYDALGKGTVKGAVTAWKSHITRKFYENAEYFVGPLWLTCYGVTMNKASWNRLSKDDQQIFTEVFNEAKERSFGIMKAGDQESIDFLTKKGNKVKVLTPNEVAEWSVPMEAVIKKWREDKGKKGFETEVKQLFDAIASAR